MPDAPIMLLHDLKGRFPSREAPFYFACFRSGGLFLGTELR